MTDESRGGVYRRGLRRFGRMALVVIGYGSIFFWLVALPTQLRWSPTLIAACWLLCALLAAAGMRFFRKLGAQVAFEILVLAILPIWGAILNASLPPCRVDACDDISIHQPFATPELYWLLALHACCALAYWVCRRRPEPLPTATEAILLALLTLGVGIDAVAAIQTIKLLPYALALPVTMPLLAPALCCLTLLTQLRARSKHRVFGTPSRAARHALWLPVPLLGLYATLEALFVGRTDAFVAVVTRTCTHPFSLGTLEILHDKNCHYLCTVAARGHANLVRPLRLGRRRGETIIVNRQLQLANAFEDLLHTRWPRFGKLARAIYDRIGLPVSRCIRTPIAADIVYLCMKPAEWCFYLALLLFDPGAPEVRIGRMYR